MNTGFGAFIPIPVVSERTSKSNSNNDDDVDDVDDDERSPTPGLQPSPAGGRPQRPRRAWGTELEPQG